MEVICSYPTRNELDLLTARAPVSSWPPTVGEIVTLEARVFEADDPDGCVGVCGPDAEPPAGMSDEAGD